MQGSELNWSRTYAYGARAIHRPRSVAEVQEIVGSGRQVRALGTRHSFNDLADSPGDLIHLGDLDPEPSIDEDAMTVSVSGAIRYGELAAYLQTHGYALPNLGSLPHISVAGACATATHGSGDANRCLSAAVSEIELVSGGGRLITAARGEPNFGALVVSLGALGIATRLTLDIEPTYDIRQDSYVDLSWPVLLANLDAVTSSAYSISLLTSWTGEVDQVWLKTRVGRDPEPPELFHGAAPQPPEQWATLTVHDSNLTPRGGTSGPWLERLPHFRLDATPSHGAEIQSEYFVDRRHAAGAIEAVRGIADRLAPRLLVGELRTIAADPLWLSPMYRRHSLGLHFTWDDDVAGVEALLPELEAALEPFDPRTHWGKVNTMPAEAIAGTYERMDDFRTLARTLDPDGQFRNAFLDRIIFDTATVRD